MTDVTIQRADPGTLTSMSRPSPVDPVRTRPSLAALGTRIEAALTAFVTQRRAELTTIDTNLAPPMDALDTLLSGGKRLRPAFCYWGWRGAGGHPGDTDDALLGAAASLELLQAAALLHDDVMDGSDTRRGRPAAHRALAELHRTAHWHGRSDAFGSGGAILLGDLCLTWSDAMYQGSDLTSEALRRGRPVFDTMRTEVMCGQYLDLVEQARSVSSVRTALHVVRYKSATYTVQRPLHLGAALAGRADLTAHYTAFGLPLGTAFQLRDDVLGVFGDPAETGKPAGDDLREGKRTVLIAATAERTTPAGLRLLNTRLGDPGLDTAGIAELRELITDSGALTACETLIDDYAARAMGALHDAPIDTDARLALTDLAVAATTRRS